MATVRKLCYKKNKGFFYPSRRFVCKSSLSRKSTTDLTENENQDCMKGVEFSKTMQNHFMSQNSLFLSHIICKLLVINCPAYSSNITSNYDS